MHDSLPPTPEPPAAPPHILRLADVKEKPLQWLWPGRIALGKLNLLVGPSGLGKSCIALDVVARLSAGNPWPDEPSNTPTPAAALLLSDRESLADTVIPRLKAAGADLARVNAVTSLSQDPVRPDSLIQSPRTHDLSRLDAAVRDTPDCRLVLIDPLFRAGPYSVAVAQTGCRVNLTPLCRLAACRQFALLAVVSLPNLVSAHAILDAVTRLPSSSIASTIWGLAPDRNQPGRHFFLSLKSTVTHDSPPLAYRIVSQEDTNVPCIVWEPHPAQVSLQDAFNGRETPPDQRDAVHWLETALASGAVPAASLLEQAAANGINARSVRNALASLGGVRFRKGFGRGANWYWALNDKQARIEQSRPQTPAEYLDEIAEKHQAGVEWLEAELARSPPPSRARKKKRNTSDG